MGWFFWAKMLMGCHLIKPKNHFKYPNIHPYNPISPFTKNNQFFSPLWPEFTPLTRIHSFDQNSPLYPISFVKKNKHSKQLKWEFDFDLDLLNAFIIALYIYRFKCSYSYTAFKLLHIFYCISTKDPQKNLKSLIRHMFKLLKKWLGIILLNKRAILKMI